MPLDSHNFDSQDCLVALMLSVSMSDANMRTTELAKIQRMVQYLPIFVDYNAVRIGQIATVTADLFDREDGLDTLFSITRTQLPERLFETAYALACDVAAADSFLGQQELRLLEEIRYELNIDRLHAAAIERGARARHITL